MDVVVPAWQGENNPDHVIDGIVPGPDNATNHGEGREGSGLPVSRVGNLPAVNVQTRTWPNDR